MRSFCGLQTDNRAGGAKAGARAQRLLWASTSTKNPELSDVRYIEELIGPNTVNTIPPATLDAFRDHGNGETTLPGDVAAAHAVLSAVAGAGVVLDDVTDALLEEGIKQFADAFVQLLETVERARQQ